MAVNNFNDFMQAYLEALSKDEDSLIELEASFEMETELPPINHGYKLTLTGLSGEQSLAAMSTATQDYNHFIVSNGYLVLNNIRICANLNDSQVWSYGGVEVGNQGFLEFSEGTIENCMSETAGAIWIRRNGRALIQNSTIKNCRGNLAGAIWVEEDGDLTMGGESLIQDCYAYFKPYGDQIVVSGTFQMNGGQITFTQQPIYNGILVSEEGKFYLVEGTISNCLSGIQLDQGSFAVINGGSIQHNDLGITSGVSGIRKRLEVTGGEIHSNRIGITLNAGAEFLMTGGKIYNHLGMDGIGVLSIYANSGYFTMVGGEIFQNIQGVCWQQNTMDCQIGKEAKIYRNAYGILVDYARVTVSGGQIFENQMPESGYAYGGIGIFAGYNSELTLEDTLIYGNQYDGIMGHYDATINIKNSRIYQNGQNGITLRYSTLYLANSEISENGACGIALDLQDFDEPQGSQFEMNGSFIRNNGEDGIRLMGISNFLMVSGEISGNVQKGINVQHQAITLIKDGLVFDNYIGIELSGGSESENAKATLEVGDVFENTIGVSILKDGIFTLGEGRIFNNYGFMENMGTEQGGIGILIHEGTCFMNGGQIYGHNGFAALPAELAFGQQLGAGVCILNTGYFEMSAGSITENTASSGAAIYVPDERYTPLKIYSEAYFNNNKATQAAFAYSGGIRHVDVNIFFAHTSLGCHILNNYDVNYQTGSLINRHFWDYFLDLNFARVVSEYLDREWEAYIAPCEFSSIKELIANDRQIRSIEGVEYLTNLEKIQLNDNHILDLSPLGHFDESLNFEAHRQWRKLSAIYVSHQQPHAVYGPSLNHIVIEIPEVSIEVEISVVPGEVIFIPVPPKQLEIEILDDSNSIMIVEIPSYQIEVEIPTNPDEGALANIPSYMIKTHIPDKMGSVSKTTVLEQTSWFTFTNATPSILSGKVSSFSIEVILKDFISTTIYKYNGQYFPDEADEQRWWQEGSHALVWWENGRNAAKWKTENFDGYVFQWATPIPINLLFPDINVATRIAQLLHKDIEDIIDITELLHITHLDFHHQSISSLEGLQFLFKLQYLNLRGTGITQSMAEGFLGADIQYGVNE